MNVVVLNGSKFFCILFGPKLQTFFPKLNNKYEQGSDFVFDISKYILEIVD